MIKLNNIEFLEIEGNKLTARGIGSLEFFEGFFFNEKSEPPVIDIQTIEKKALEVFSEEAPPEAKKKKSNNGKREYDNCSRKKMVSKKEEKIKEKLIEYFQKQTDFVEFPISINKSVIPERKELAEKNIAYCENKDPQKIRQVLREMVSDGILKRKGGYQGKKYFKYTGDTLAHPEGVEEEKIKEPGIEPKIEIENFHEPGSSVPEVRREKEKDLRECKSCRSFFIPVGVENTCKDCLTKKLAVKDKVKDVHERYIENRERAKSIQKTIEWREELLRKQAERAIEELQKPEDKEPDLQTVKALLLSYFKKYYPARHWIPDNFANLQKPEEKNRAEEVFDITGTENPEKIHQAMSELLSETKLIIGRIENNRNFYQYYEEVK